MEGNPPRRDRGHDDGYHHPASEDEVSALVRRARAEGRQLRVRGSGHSVPAAVLSDARLRGERGAVDVVLDRMAAVDVDEAARTVTVQGGCRFGRDPRDPTGRSSARNGLSWQLDRRCLALPNLGGIAHQTVAGFLATGSSGASRLHDLHARVEAVRVVDGAGEARELTAARDGEGFLAAGVAMGLLGVVTSVTFRCDPRYDLVGEEVTSDLDGCGIDLFGDGARSLERFLLEREYARLLWWPQPGVDRLVAWTARRMAPGDYDARTGPPGALVRAPYDPFPPLLGTTLPMQAAAGAALTHAGRLPPGLRSRLYRAFVPVDRAPRPFRDTWWQGLPMDDVMDERLLPTTFTEAWVPASRAAEAMRRLRALFARRGWAASGRFALEIYAAPRGRFLLSPAQGEDAVRFNFFWFDRGPEDPARVHFPQFWELFDELGATLHWGKHLPPDARLRERYPGWDAFHRARERFDPDQVFVSDYWRRHLGVPAAPARPRLVEPPTPAPPEAPPPSPPLAFALEPVDASFADRAPFVIDNAVTVDAPPERVHAMFADPREGARWIPLFRGATWRTGERGEGAVLDESFAFMTLRLRVLESVPGRRWVAAVEACTLPLADAMLEVIEFEPAPGGRTAVRWRVFYDPAPALRPAHALVRAPFAAMFRAACSGLAAYVARGGSS